MTTFQIISLIISLLVMLGTIAGVYIRLRTDIVKIEVQLSEIKRELLQKDVAVLLAEKNNREDHITIMAKLDKLIDKLL